VRVARSVPEGHPDLEGSVLLAETIQGRRGSPHNRATAWLWRVRSPFRTAGGIPDLEGVIPAGGDDQVRRAHPQPFTE